MFDVMTHRHGKIWLAIKNPCNRGDGALWHELPHEHNSPPPGVCRFFANVKSQVHFFEIAMQRNRKAEQAGVEKKETDDAEKGLTIVEINFGSRRNERADEFRIHRVVEHGEIAPIRSEKRSHGFATLGEAGD